MILSAGFCSKSRLEIQTAEYLRMVDSGRFGDDIDLDLLADFTEGFSGADI